MLVSLNFVEKFISLPIVQKEIIVNHKKIIEKIFDIEKIAPILTCQGFEIDQITMIGDSVKSIIVGKIIETKPHPNANKLKICLVDVGENNLRQIVCGASNARENLYVAVALPGTKLKNEIEIKPTLIREIESLGMLCSREELGLPINKEFDGEGIWELQNQAQGGISTTELEKHIGFPVYVALNLNDTILEMSVTPNRPDMLCHQGVARELAAGFTYAKIPFDLKKPSFVNQSSIQEEKIKADVKSTSKLQVHNYSFRAENDLDAQAFFMVADCIEVTHSPSWIRNILESLGQPSINNIVDASNYILLAYGQPSHAFDFNKLEAENNHHKKLILRYAYAKENFIGLDGKTRELNETDCIVADIKQAQALLGIIGGDNSKVTNNTKTIVVEFANPHPVAIRRSSRRHGRQTEASFLFEKGIDESARYKACSEFFALIQKISSPHISYIGTTHSETPQDRPVLKDDINAKIISFKSDDQIRILGALIVDFKTQLNILSSLGFLISNQNENSADITVPSWRQNDIANENDLIEECIRVVGIDHIPAHPMLCTNELNKDDPHLLFIEKLNTHTANLGYNEVLNFHFMRADDYKKCNLNFINQLSEPLVLLNPVIGDEPFMHTTLIPDLLRKVSKNINYGIKKGQLFHSCRTFQNYNKNGQRVFKDNGVTLQLEAQLALPIEINLKEYSYQYGHTYSFDETNRPVETPRLSGVIFGVKEEKTWQNMGEIKWSLHDLIAHVVELGRICGLKNLQFEKIENNSHPMATALHPGRRVEFFISQQDNSRFPIGWCGEFHPKVRRLYEIDTPCFGFELNVANLRQASFLSSHGAGSPSPTTDQKFPTVYRDFAFLIEDQITAANITAAINDELHEIITKQIPVTLLDVHIFDIYKGKGVAQDKKSIAFKISLQPTIRTLTDKDIQILSDAVVKAVQVKLKGNLRGS